MPRLIRCFRTAPIAPVIVALFISTGPARAAELYALAGGMRSDDPETHSYSWTLSYVHRFSERLSASFDWLNEGHVPSHHRDGHALQLWARAPTSDPRLSLAVGIGPYRYFDTTAADRVAGYANSHGWGTIYSIAATWDAHGPWLYQLRLARVDTEDNIDTTLVIAGVGYRLKRDVGTTPENIGAARNEVTLYMGQTIVNSFESESSEAVAVEYKRRFGPLVRGSLALLYEGDARLVRRDGTVAQLWLEPSFFGDRFSVGVGGGIYHAIDDSRGGRTTHRASGIATVTASYRVTGGWVGRFAWNRIVTDYDRDTDVFMLGLGYRF